MGVGEGFEADEGEEAHGAFGEGLLLAAGGGEAEHGGEGAGAHEAVASGEDVF